MEGRKKRRNNLYTQSNSKRKNRWKLPCLILFAVMIFVYYQVFILFKYTAGKPVTEKQMAVYKWLVKKINSSEENTQDTSLQIGVLGNITVKNSLTKAYDNLQNNGFNSIFKYMNFKDYDFTIATLNTQITKEKTDNKYSSSTDLLKELKSSKIDLLNIASENISSLSNKDVKETINNIKQNGFDSVGSKENGKNYYIIDKNDIKIGVLSYIGKEYDNQSNLINVYSKSQIVKDVQSIKEQKVDGIIVFIDTYRNSKLQIESEKRKILEGILQEGVDVVISNDTIYQDVYKNQNKYIIYSLGDYIGDQKSENSDISKLIKISILKKANSKKAKTTFNVTVDKTLVALSNVEKTRYKIVDMEEELKRFDENKAGNITKSEYEYLKTIKGNNKKIS